MRKVMAILITAAAIVSTAMVQPVSATENENHDQDRDRTVVRRVVHAVVTTSKDCRNFRERDRDSRFLRFRLCRGISRVQEVSVRNNGEKDMKVYMKLRKEFGSEMLWKHLRITIIARTTGEHRRGESRFREESRMRVIFSGRISDLRHHRLLVARDLDPGQTVKIKEIVSLDCSSRILLCKKVFFKEIFTGISRTERNCDEHQDRNHEECEVR